MARRPSSPRTVDFQDLNSKVSLPPPPRLPREASDVEALGADAAPGEEAPLDLERVLTQPPAGRPDSGVFTVAPNPLAPPTLAPPAKGSATRDGLWLVRVGLALTILLGASAASYALGREHGEVHGELSATRQQLAVISPDGSLESPTRGASANPAPAAPAVIDPEPVPVPDSAPASATEEIDGAAVFAPLSSRAPASEPSARSAHQVPQAPAASADSAGSDERAETIAQPAELAIEPAPGTDPEFGSTVVDDATEEGEPDASPLDAADAPDEASADEGSADEVAATEPLARSLAELLAENSPEPAAAPALPERPSRSDVRSALNGVVPGVRRCAGGAGPITVSIRVAPDGHVTSSDVTEGELSPAVERCVVSAVSEARFPAFSGRDFHISYPFRL